MIPFPGNQSIASLFQKIPFQPCITDSINLQEIYWLIDISFAGNAQGVVTDIHLDVHFLNRKVVFFQKHTIRIKLDSPLKKMPNPVFFYNLSSLWLTLLNTCFVYCPWLSKPIHWAEIERNGDDVNLMESRVMLANEFIDEIINK